MTFFRTLTGKLMDWVVSLSLIALVVVVFLQVFYRYIFAAPITWSEEMARFIFVWIALLGTFLSINLADGLSRVIFQGIVPILIIAWFAEDTARIFTSELILTSQRIWTKGSPYAWTDGREIPLEDIKSISARRDAIFIQLKSAKKATVHAFPNGRQIVEAYNQFTQKAGTA